MESDSGESTFTAHVTSRGMTINVLDNPVWHALAGPHRHHAIGRGAARHYAREAFERYQADAVTLSPYLGYDSVAPYLAYPDKGVILLCRTSNPGGSDLQFLDVGGQKLYEYLAQLVATKWNPNGQCALVVGATFPAEIARVRELVGDMPLLVPGIGAQGGDVAATVRAGRTPAGQGLIINSSRAILYAGQDENFAAAARQAAQETRDLINLYR